MGRKKSRDNISFGGEVDKDRQRKKREYEKKDKRKYYDDDEDDEDEEYISYLKQYDE